jgi:hypothetical protein
MTPTKFTQNNIEAASEVIMKDPHSRRGKEKGETINTRSYIRNCPGVCMYIRFKTKDLMFSLKIKC